MNIFVIQYIFKVKITSSTPIFPNLNLNSNLSVIIKLLLYNNSQVIKYVTYFNEDYQTICYLSDTFNRIHSRSEEVWHWHHYWIRGEFKRRSVLPIPLSVISHMIVVVKYLHKKRRTKKRKKEIKLQRKIPWVALICLLVKVIFSFDPPTLHSIV